MVEKIKRRYGVDGTLHVTHKTSIGFVTSAIEPDSNVIHFGWCRGWNGDDLSQSVALRQQRQWEERTHAEEIVTRTMVAAASKRGKEMRAVALPIIGEQLWALRSVRRLIRETLGHLPLDQIRVILTKAVTSLESTVRYEAQAPSLFPPMSLSRLAKTFNGCIRDEVKRAAAEPAKTRRRA